MKWNRGRTITRLVEVGRSISNNSRQLLVLVVDESRTLTFALGFWISESNSADMLTASTCSSALLSVPKVQTKLRNAIIQCNLHFIQSSFVANEGQSFINVRVTAVQIAVQVFRALPRNTNDQKRALPSSKIASKHHTIQLYVPQTRKLEWRAANKPKSGVSES
jgi:hypothetical protein